MAGSDDGLLERAIEGDRRALVTLLETHSPAVRQRFRSRIPRRWQSVLSVDDIVQQTSADAFLNIDRFVPHGPDSFVGWLITLAKCNFLDALKMLEAEKRGGNHRRVEAVDREESCLVLYELLGDSVTTPSQHAARAEACHFLEEMIEQLPETYRLVVQMYDLEGRSIDDVADRLDRSVGATFMLRARAHRRLAELMGRASQYLTGSG